MLRNQSTRSGKLRISFRPDYSTEFPFVAYKGKTRKHFASLEAAKKHLDPKGIMEWGRPV